jgi:hypothetical protein
MAKTKLLNLRKKKIVFDENNEDYILTTKNDILSDLRDFLYNMKDGIDLDDVYSIILKNGKSIYLSQYDDIKKFKKNMISNIAHVLWISPDGAFIFYNPKYKKQLEKYAGTFKIMDNK